MRKTLCRALGKMSASDMVMVVVFDAAIVDTVPAQRGISHRLSVVMSFE
jgi:predicted RNA-binding protein with PIN domain